MKIATFNVNSIRARLPVLLDWLDKSRPDILAVQETKAQDVDFPADAFDKIGYKYAFKGQKSYNGVAIFSKAELKNVHFGLDDDPKDMPRLIMANISRINIINTYIPQGFEPESEKFQYKLKWFERLRKFFENHCTPDKPVLWLGDFNVAPLPIDVYDPKALIGHVCFNKDVKKALENVMQWGFVDIFRKHCKEPEQYTFWDYRIRAALKRNRGWRLDHIMATKSLAEKSTACYIDIQPRLAQRPSDHTPIIAEFDWQI